jgi:hypothetical protein
MTVDVNRNGIAIAACTSPATPAANPDPCVVARTVSATGDLTIVVRTSQFSTWTLTKHAPALFDIRGFLLVDPRDPPKVKGGSLVPLVFTLGGDKGPDVLATGSPTSRPVACPSSGPKPQAGNAAPTSGSLHYVPLVRSYIYLWRTGDAWKGCRELTMTFVTGQELRAVLRFT